MKKWILGAIFFSVFSILLGGEEAADRKAEESLTASTATESVEKEGRVAVDSENSPWIPASQTEIAGRSASRGRRVFNTVKNILFFVIVLAILFLLFRVLKRVSVVTGSNDDFIQIISTKQLMGNRYLHVVKLGEEYFLIGSAEGNVNLIKKIENKDLITELDLYKEKNAQPDQKNFIDRFRFVLKSEKGELSIKENLSQTVKNIKNRTNKMKKM